MVMLLYSGQAALPYGLAFSDISDVYMCVWMDIFGVAKLTYRTDRSSDCVRLSVSLCEYEVAIRVDDVGVI